MCVVCAHAQPTCRACSDLIQSYIETLTVLISPICPHWAQHVWSTLMGRKGFVVDARWPTAQPVDANLSRQKQYLMHAAHGFRLKLDEFKKKNKATAVGAALCVVSLCCVVSCCVVLCVVGVRSRLVV